MDNRIVTFWVDSVARTVTLGVSRDELEYQQALGHGLRLTWIPLGQLYAAVNDISLEDVFRAAFQKQNTQIILLAGI